MKKLVFSFKGVLSLVTFALLFLGVFNFYNRYYVWFFLAAAIFFLNICELPIYVNRDFLILVFFSMCIVIFSPDTFIKYTYLIKPFIYPICYLIGVYSFSMFKTNEIEEQNKRIKYAWIVISFALSIYVCLNLSVNINITNREELIDYWTQDIASATIMAAVAVIPLAVAIAILIVKNNLFTKIYAILVLGVVLYFNLLLSGRTLFLMALIVVVAGLAFVAKARGNFSSVIKACVILLVICSICALVYSSNAFGIKDLIEESPFYDRFFGEQSNIELDEDGRLKNKLDYLDNMVLYPFGGDKLRESLSWRSAHDLYLDTYSYSSVFSFLLIVAYMLSSIKRIFVFIRNKSNELDIRVMVFCVGLLMNIEFFLEPILRGIPWFFAIYCLMDGMLTSVMRFSSHDTKLAELK